MSDQLRSSLGMLLVLLGLAQTLRAVQAYGTELSQSVSIFRLQELTDPEYLNGRSATRCEHMIDRAASYGSSRVNFMITQFYIDIEGDFVPNSYCWKPDDNSGCVPFTQDAIDKWTRALTQCLQHAVLVGFTGIAFTPHLDPWSAGQLIWRNIMLINPLQKYDGFSYTDVMLLPLARAMNSVMADNLTVWFALQGEMTAMVMHYPQEHQRLFAYIKSLIIQGNPTWAPSVRMGLSNNSNKLCGPNMEVCTKETIASNYNLPAISAMYHASDFIGMSCYPRFEPNDVSTMEGPANDHNEELQLFGIDLATLVNIDGKEFFLSEYGVGGGMNGAGNEPAQSIQDAMSEPFFGISGSYTRYYDPWASSLPTTVISPTKQYLQDWYKGSTRWLSHKGGPTYRVDGAFLWGINSWDTLATHPTSTTKEGSYLNQDAAQTVKEHNLQIRGETWASLGQNPGTIAPY